MRICPAQVPRKPEVPERLRCVAPEEVQAALEDNVFGEKLSRMMGQVWDESDSTAKAETEAAADNRIVVASEEDQAKFAEMAARVRTKVFAELDAAGVDAEAAYEFVKAEMAKESQ